MLFAYNRMWKNLSLLLGFWALYALLGFEFTSITLLTLILANLPTNSSNG